jgi:hypothetical protein
MKETVELMFVIKATCASVDYDETSELTCHLR